MRSTAVTRGHLSLEVSAKQVEAEGHSGSENKTFARTYVMFGDRDDVTALFSLYGTCNSIYIYLVYMYTKKAYTGVRQFS